MSRSFGPRVGRVVRRTYQILNTVLAFVAGLPEHWRQTGESLPSLGTRLWEQCRLLVVSGVNAKDYYVHALYRREMGFSQKAAFVGNFESWRWICKVSSFEHLILTEDKAVFERYARAHGVPTTTTFAVVGDHDASTTTPPIVGYDRFGDWLLEQQCGDLFLKPISGIGGREVLSLGEWCSRESVWKRLPVGDSVSIADVLQHVSPARNGSKFLVQRRLVPEPSLHRFHPSVTHTVRTITIVHGDGAHVVCAALKIGVGGHAADNLLRGDNIVAPIDLETGRLGPGVMIRGLRPVRIREHPGTGATISGFQVPEWTCVVDVAERAALAFDMNRISSWDIALTTEGPRVIEANIVFDPILVQISHDRGLLAFTAMEDFVAANHLGSVLGFGLNPYIRSAHPRNEMKLPERRETSP